MRKGLSLAMGWALAVLASQAASAQQALPPDSLRAAPKADSSAPDPRTAQPERPTVATHAFAVAPGIVEIEAGVQVTRPSGASATQVPVVVKYGVARRVQVELIGGWSRTSTSGRPGAGGIPAVPASASSGFGDLAVAPKIRMLFDAPVLANFSVQPSVKFPTGSVAQGTGTGTTDVGLLLISSRTFGPVELDLNAGGTLRSGDGNNAPRTATLLTASAGSTVHGPIGWVLELFDYPGTAGPAGTPPQIGLLTGPTLTIYRWLVLDAGGIANVHGFAANSAYAGLTWNAGRLR